MLAWVKINSFGGYNKIITKENSYEILLGPDAGVLRMALYPVGASDWQWLNTSTKPLVKNTWQLVAATYDGNKMQLYVNGRQVAERAIRLTINDTANSVDIGGNVVDNKEWFKGAIDEVAVFNYALSIDDIDNIYQSGVGSYLAEAGIPTRDDNAGQVLGVSNMDNPKSAYACNPDLGYTKIKALYRTSSSPDIWAILATGQKHYITSPESMAEYQCDWSQVKTVSQAKLDSYADARLVRTVSDSTVYYLYQRPEVKWLKLAIPSPTVFISYPQNYWGNIAVINDLDVAAYPNVELIKTADNSSVYYLANNQKQLIPSTEVFTKHNFLWFQVVTVNQYQLDSYADAGILQ